MKPLSIVKMAVLSVSLFTVLQATAAMPTCEEEIKEANAFLSSQGMVPVNNVTDLATTLRHIKTLDACPTAISPRMRPNASAGRVVKTNRFGE